jgi:glutamine---fructose-6-phosphate transaminase (isomerizing)
MCGIIACLNCENQINILLEGLNQLQNRGYDSCGITVVDSNSFKTQKYASTQEEQGLKKLKNQINLPQTKVGIAHTRWATHGAKNDINAHPHIDFKESVSLVHNGIITNYGTLKKFLISEGYQFYGETDSEVIANIISFHLQKTENHFLAFKKAINQLEGSWGLVVIFKDKSESLFISKSGSPILLGKTEEGILVGSESSAFCNRSRSIISLEEGDILEINLDNVNTGDGEYKSLSSFFKNRDIISLEKISFQKTPYPFPHWMIKEIMEQPIAIQRTLNYGARISDDKIVLGGLNNEYDLFKNRDEIVILGCGTSLNAGLWISYILKKNKIFKNVKVIDASEFEVYDISESDKTICVVLSQSGETKDVHRCMVKIKTLNIPIIGIVNSVGSLIARDSNCGIYLNAGREVSVASTKSFVCQQIALVLLALWFQEKHSINVFSRETIKELRFLSSHVENTLVEIEKLKNIAQQLVTQKSCFLLGKNIYETIAREGALKLKEIGYIHAEAFAGGSLKHGPFSLIEEGTPIFLFIMDDIYKDFMMSTLEEVKSRGANIIVISNLDIKIKNLIRIPKLDNLGSILSILPLQIIAYEMALIKGHNPDYPRNLAKVVTVD